jgi:acyl carrier protein
VKLYKGFEKAMGEHRVKDIILEIIATIAPDADLSDVKSDVRLRDQLDMDSMDFLDIVMELRKRYKIEVPKEDYPNLATLDGCVTYLAPKFESVAAS